MEEWVGGWEVWVIDWAALGGGGEGVWMIDWIGRREGREGKGMCMSMEWSIERERAGVLCTIYIGYTGGLPIYFPLHLMYKNGKNSAFAVLYNQVQLPLSLLHLLIHTRHPFASRQLDIHSATECQSTDRSRYHAKTYTYSRSLAFRHHISTSTFSMIQNIRPHRHLDTIPNIRARVQQIPLLENKHPSYLGFYIERALHVVRVERRRSAFEFVDGGSRPVEVEMDGEVRDLGAVWGLEAGVVVR